MNAKELTKVVNEQSNRIIELEKDMEYLKQEFKKQRMFIDDLKIDVKMLEKMR